MDNLVQSFFEKLQFSMEKNGFDNIFVKPKQVKCLEHILEKWS